MKLGRSAPCSQRLARGCGSRRARTSMWFARDGARGLGEGFAARSSVREPRRELLERVDDRRRRVIARPEAAAAAGWADGTACAGPKAGGALPASTRSAEQKLAKPPAAAPRVSIERVESSVEAAGWGARWGWSRSPKALRAPHAELSGRDEHDAPCRASWWCRGAAAPRILHRQALALQQRLARRPPGPGIGRIARNRSPSSFKASRDTCAPVR